MSDEIIYTDSLGSVLTQPGDNPKVYLLSNINLAATIGFQQGDPKQNDVNGFTNEAVIAAVIHRLTLQNKLLPCSENEAALRNLKYALTHLEYRSKVRTDASTHGKEAA